MDYQFGKERKYSSEIADAMELMSNKQLIINTMVVFNIKIKYDTSR